MKKIFLLALLLSVVLSVSILSSCSDSPDLSVPIAKDEPQEEIVDPELAFYPKASRNVKSRAQSNGFWESLQEITLDNGMVKPTPWNNTGTVSTVPSDILKDIEYDKGWDLIYYPKGTNGRLLTNYLVFHNRYTGIIKFFYYNTSNSANNNAIWNISFENPTSALAFYNSPISLSSKKEKKENIQFNNLAKTQSKGFINGWNCFMFELAYDPTLSGALKINPYNSNQMNISFSGTNESTTQGEIVSYQSGGVDKTKYNGIVKRAGNDATDWVKKKIGEKKFLGISSDLIAKAASSLFTSGVSELIGGITGLFSSKEPKTQSVYLTTTGTFAATGVVTFEATGIIETLSLNLDPSYVGRLGVWCLEESPKLYFSPYGTYRSVQTYSNGYTREYVSNITSKRSAKIRMNPDLLSEISSHGCTTTFYESDYIKRDNGFGGQYANCTLNLPKSTRLYNDLHSPNQYLVANVAFKDNEGAYIPVEYLDAPPEVALPNVPNGPVGATPNINMPSYYVASITVKMTTPAGDLAQSVHTYYPELVWNYDEYNNGLYWYLYPNMPVSTINGY